jgi:hypothetical protein
MSTLTAALALVPRQEITRPEGPGLLEWLAREAFARHREKFVRPLLRADSRADLEAALSAPRLGYAASQVGSTALTLAVRPWRVVTPELTDRFYAETRERLESSQLEPETAQMVDYVIYSSCRIALAMMRRGLLRPRPGYVAPRVAFKQVMQFDLLSSAAFMAADAPHEVKNPAIFSHVMSRAVDSTDRHLALLAELGYIQ